MRIILSALLLPYLAEAAVQKLSYKVNDARTSIELNWDGQKLTAVDKHMNLTVEKNKCSQKHIEDFLKTDEAAFRDVPASKPYPVEVVKNGKTMSVSAQSRLGKHLLTVGDKVRYLAMLIDKKCPKKK